METQVLNDLPIVLRQARDSDLGFIVKTWSQEVHKVNPQNFIPNEIFFPHQNTVMTSILSTQMPLMACLEGDEDTLAGYLIAKPYGQDNLIIYYGFVKSIFRRMGIMKQMLSHFNYQNKNLVCTQYFDLFKKLKDRYHLIYDPTILEIHA